MFEYSENRVESNRVSWRWENAVRQGIEEPWGRTRVAETAITRRSLLIGAGALGAVSVLTGSAKASGERPSVSTRSSVDICIIGAGFAGLTAAREAARQGASVVVVEARDRVGGRVLNGVLSNGDAIEEGGQWVGPTQTAVVDLASELGVFTYDTYNIGDNLLDLNGTITRFPASPGFPPLGGADTIEFVLRTKEVNELADLVGSQAPWDAVLADHFDKMTLQQWMDDNLLTDGARFLWHVSVKGVFTVEPSELSFLFFLMYVAAAGGWGPLISVENGAQQSRFIGGSQLVPIRMAEEMRSGSIRLNTAVNGIEQLRDSVMVHTNRGQIPAGSVICTLPPTLAGRIRYEPILPARRDQLTQRMPQGSVIKANVEFPEPFWRRDGLSGQFLRDAGLGRFGFDNSPFGDRVGVLNVFITGDEARQTQQLPELVRRQLVLNELAEMFGPEAASPTQYIEMDWSNEEFTRGCYGGFLGPGALVPYGPALREPVGRIHWAGTESAETWMGYMEGAVRSGLRAAGEILGP